MLPVFHLALQPKVDYWFVYTFKIVHLIRLTYRHLPLNVAVLMIYTVLHSENTSFFIFKLKQKYVMWYISHATCNNTLYVYYFYLNSGLKIFAGKNMFPYFTMYVTLFYKGNHVLAVWELIRLLMYIVYEL